MISLEIKKIAAREFLYFTASLLFIVLIYAFILVNNRYQKSRANIFKDEIFSQNNKYQNFLSQPLKLKNVDLTQSKLDEFANFVVQEKDITNENLLILMPELNNDSISLKGLYKYGTATAANIYKYKKEQNLNFPEFFDYKQSDIDTIKYYQSKIEALEKTETKFKNRIISKCNNINCLFKISCFTFLFTFVFRYIFHATKWSIKTIRSKD